MKDIVKQILNAKTDLRTIIFMWAVALYVVILLVVFGVI